MRPLPLIWMIVICLGWPTESRGTSVLEILARRDRLERIFDQQCAAIQIDEHAGLQREILKRIPGRSLVFLPQSTLDALGNSRLSELGRKYAESLVKLGETALQDGGDATLAYQLFHQAAAFDKDARARNILGKQADERITVSRANTNHPRLPWKRREYWRVTTEHYQIVTNKSSGDGVEIARRLEDLYTVWQQLFFAYWSNSLDLQSAWKRSRLLKPKSNRKHRIVLFSSREEYVAFLRPKQQRIEITLGFYDINSETSFFFAGPDSSTATQLHEATHQLFQETKSTSGKLTMKHNFWVIEGIAMYMESLHVLGIAASIGGPEANRLQFARYRCLQEQFYLPLDKLVVMGRDEFQQDERIRRIYSQSAGLAHFLMDGQSGKYRSGLTRYLGSIYEGRDRIDSLEQATGASLAQLDREYRDFLDVDDNTLIQAHIKVDSLRSLCLGDTSVSDKGLQAILPQANLEWLDLARTSTTDAGLGFLPQGTRLVQVNLDGTDITDKTLARLAANTGLEELDLSNTRITDGGLRHLSGLPLLRVLWLNGTSVTDASVELLCAIKSLEQLGIGQTNVTDDGRQLLRRKFPGLAID